MTQKRQTIIAALALLLAAAGTVQAVSWTGSALDGEWGNANNWDTLAVPAGAVTVVIADPSLTDTVIYHDGDTNSVNYITFDGGMTFNMTGGLLSPNKSHLSNGTWVGYNGSAVLNLTGGEFYVGHVLRLGAGTSGSDGVVNLDGGFLRIFRAGNSQFGNPLVSLSLSGAGNGVFNLDNGTFETRFGVEVGGQGTFNVQGAGSTISIGGHGGANDGGWYQESNSVLRVGIASDGVSPIMINDDPTAAGVPSVAFKEGALLDVGFAGSSEVGSWDLMTFSDGSLTDNGLQFAAGVDTTIWSFAFVDTDLSGQVDTLRVTAIPEPATLGLVGMACALALFIRRFRM